MLCRDWPGRRRSRLTPEADAPGRRFRVGHSADVAELEVLKAAPMDPPNDESSNVVQLDPRRQATRPHAAVPALATAGFAGSTPPATRPAWNRAEIIAATAQLIGPPIDTLKGAHERRGGRRARRVRIEGKIR